MFTFMNSRWFKVLVVISAIVPVTVIVAAVAARRRP